MTSFRFEIDCNMHRMCHKQYRHSNFNLKFHRLILQWKKLPFAHVKDSKDGKGDIEKEDEQEQNDRWNIDAKCCRWEWVVILKFFSHLFTWFLSGNGLEVECVPSKCQACFNAWYIGFILRCSFSFSLIRSVCMCIVRYTPFYRFVYRCVLEWRTRHSNALKMKCSLGDRQQNICRMNECMHARSCHCVFVFELLRVCSTFISFYLYFGWICVYDELIPFFPFTHSLSRSQWLRHLISFLMNSGNRKWVVEKFSILFTWIYIERRK